MSKENKLASLILGCQLVKPSFDLTKLKDHNFSAKQYVSKIIDTKTNGSIVSIFNYYPHNVANKTS